MTPAMTPWVGSLVSPLQAKYECCTFTAILSWLSGCLGDKHLGFHENVAVRVKDARGLKQSAGTVCKQSFPVNFHFLYISSDKKA